MIPSPTVLLAGLLGFILWSAGISAYWNHHGHKAASIEYEAIRNQERASAATLQAEYEKRARESDNKSSALAIELEAEHEKHIADIDAGALAFSVRLAAARSAHANCVPATPANPGVVESIAERGNGGFGEPDPGTRLREVGLKLQTYAKLCNSWALSVGR